MSIDNQDETEARQDHTYMVVLAYEKISLPGMGKEESFQSVVFYQLNIQIKIWGNWFISLCIYDHFEQNEDLNIERNTIKLLWGK